MTSPQGSPCGSAANGSSDANRSRDYKQPCPDDNDPNGSRDTVTVRCEPFEGGG